jgi:hypothetical protein
MGRAEDLFRRLSEQGEQAIEGLIEDRQSEELFLDFKRSADNGSGKRLHDNDRWNLAKAISGFANSEGGVIVWGVDCRDTSGSGDVASAKVPIQNPKRFVSWLEGVVSGCTVPAHPLVRHTAVESSPGLGFAVSHIPKSYLALHQCLKPLQYYIRAGSDFVPTPHAVLEGLFGRRPQPFVFHMWTIQPAKVVQQLTGLVAVECSIGFMLGSHGPGLARDLYVNLKIFPPKGASQGAVSISDQTNWTGQHAFGVMWNLVSIDAFKLAPQSMTRPIVLQLSFAPPCESDFWYEITFGHQGSPVRKVEARVIPEVLQEAYEACKDSGEGDEIRREFIDIVMDIKETEERGPEIYESLE